MKLRQKLAVALASAMVVTSVPVVTMAASDNNLTKDTVVVTKDTTLADATTAPALKLELKDYSGQKETFYLKLTNAEWNEEALKALKTEGYTISDITDDEITITVKAGLTGTPDIRVPLLTTITEKGDATVEVIKMGTNTTVTTGKYVFATTSDAAVIATTIKADDVPTLYTTGTIADIKLTESMAGAFAQAVKDGDDEVELTLDNSEYEFTSVGKVELAYGFQGQGNNASDVQVSINKDDKQVITVKLPGNFKADSIGQIKLTGITVKSTSKAPATGDLIVNVDGDAVEKSVDLKVADIAEYGSKITIEEDDKVDIKAGKTEEVIFTLEETEKESFVNGRELDFTLNKGFFMNQVEDEDGDFDEDATIAAMQKAIKIKNTITNQDLKVTDVEVNDDDQVIGFTAEMVSSAKLDEIEVKANITAGLEEEGDVTVTVSGRAVEKEVSAVITTIKKTVTVNTEAAVLKVGLKNQLAGKVVLTEAEKGTFKTGSKVEFTVPVENGITVTEAPEIKVTSGDIQFEDAKVSAVDKDTQTVKVTATVKRASKTASTVEFTNFEFATDRTVAEGTFDVTLGGSALSDTETMDLEDFLVIGTPNTEDLGSNGLVKGTSTFVIGESKYTVNGVEKAMDAKSYVQNPGYTMVPMRYVAEAFGITGNNVLFSNGVATIFAGNRTIQLTNNSDIALVNGIQVKMATKVVIKEGRTYAPIGEVAQLLGVSKAWDNTTKTATFTNK